MRRMSVTYRRGRGVEPLRVPPRPPRLRGEKEVGQASNSPKTGFDGNVWDGRSYRLLLLTPRNSLMDLKITVSPRKSC